MTSGYHAQYFTDTGKIVLSLTENIIKLWSFLAKDPVKVTVGDDPGQRPALKPAKHRIPGGCSQPSLQLGAGSSISAVPHTDPQAPISRCSALNVLDLGFTQLLKYFPGGRSRGQATGWYTSASLKSHQTTLEDGEHR